MNKLDTQYQDLLKDILENGHTKKDRTGTGTISVFGKQIRHKMSDGFPLLTTKKMYFKGIVTELLWFLRGDTSIEYLLNNGCHIWDGDALKNFNKHIGEENVKMSSDPLLMYQPKARWGVSEFIERIKTDPGFAAKWGNLGPIYGKQWRAWNNYKGDEISENGFEMSNYPIDQIANSINLLKTDPDSRRNIVSAWNVGEIHSMVLPPCHAFFQFYTRELTFEERWNLAKERGNVGEDAIMPTADATYLSLNERDEINSLWDDPVLKTDLPKRAISLMWYQRSCDVPLGLPFNIASYGLLLEIVGKMVNMVPDELIGTLGDTHIYLNQVDGVKEQIGRQYTSIERLALLKDAMGEEKYNQELSELQPFGGGMNGYCELYNIPTQTREPYALPILSMGKSNQFYEDLSEDLSLISHLDPEDFEVKNYQSHPTIKYPLSN
jgi:thymidylate synthase